jgi:hypothetical protein
MQCFLIDREDRRRHVPGFDGNDSLIVDLGEASRPVSGSTRVIRFKDYVAKVPNLFGDAGLQLQDWSHLPLSTGVPFKDAIQARGFSLWRMLDTHLQFGTVNSSCLHDVFRDIRALRALIAEHHPSGLAYLGSDPTFAAVAAACAQAAGIPWSAPDLSRVPGWKRTAKVNAVAVAYWAQFALRKLAFVFQRPLFGRLPADSRPAVFIVSRDDWETVQDRESGSAHRGERHYQSVFDSLKAECRFFVAVHLHNSRLWIKHPLEKKRLRFQFAPIESGVGFFSLIREYRKVRCQWREIRNAPGFAESLRFEGVDCSALLLPRFDAFFKTAAVESVAGILAAEALLERERPAMLLHGLETSGVGKAFLFFAKKLGIPSVVLQHGTITPLHPAGTPDPRDVNFADPGSSSWPFPDVMALYGEFGRRAMIQSNWPPELLRVTGAPRWDFLPGCDRHYSREQTCARLGLDAAKPLFVYLGTDLASQEARSVIRTICRALDSIEGAQLIVKLHPFDREEAVVREVLRAEGRASAPVFRQGSLFEFVVAGDLVLSVTSTAVIEAALIGRPVVVVDPERRDYAGIFPYEFVKTAATVPDLAGILTRWISDGDYRSQWMSKREAFVADQCYRADGKATERLCELLREARGAPEAAPGTIVR